MDASSPSDAPPSAAAAVAEAVSRASVAWLAAANLVGLLLATLLCWPGLGRLLGPLTYGRWMPLHLDWHLYGWCALPLVGLLFRACLVDGPDAVRHARWALAAWSAALAGGGLSWLAGRSSGKLFLDWTGATALAFPLALSFLWSLLAAHQWTRFRRLRAAAGAPTGRDWLVAALVVALLAVPSVLHWAASPRVYPAINPDSGGATGTSLLGSTLGILAVCLLAPVLLGRPRRKDAGRRGGALVWTAWGGAWLAFLLVPHGNVSHHAAGQIAALALVLPWPFLVLVHWRSYHWEPGATGWLGATLAWGLALAITGWVTFLPGALERLKFTNGLVAHAHLAMAGFVTSLNMVVLLHLGASRRVRAALASPGAFRLWHGAAALQVVVLLALGWHEGLNPSWLFAGDGPAAAGYLVRLGAGAAMTIASLRWLAGLQTRAAELPLPPS